MQQRGAPALPGNELVMRIQPDEACFLNTFSKEPGLATVVKPTRMEMSWATQFKGAYVGDAYEKMLLFAAGPTCGVHELRAGATNVNDCYGTWY